ncbi:MAG TPA: metal ABC transporter substrate-binding protein [Actinomycetota bacterium]|nr:metal ABC transporter substrate-binding protein [Actinomycetota bacterium]
MTIGVALALPACSQGVTEDPEGLRVAAGFFPIAEAAEIVGGPRVHVENLTPPGSDPHDVELTPDEVDLILDADLLLYLGGGFQSGVEELAERRDGASLDLLEGVETIEGTDEHEGEEEGHEGEEVDPHIWLDMLRYARLVERVGEALVEVDAEGAEAYRERAGAHTEEIRALDERFAGRLAACERDLLVVSHAAFGYLADRYGLHQEAITGISPESEPDPQRLAELTDLVRSEGVTTVFTETLVSPDVAETLAREAGVETAVLNPLEGLTEEEDAAGETYLSVMESNLETIAEALGCPG